VAYNKSYREKKKSALKSDSTQELSVNEFEGEDWQQALLDRLKKISPPDFERLSQRLLRESGFTKVEVKGKTGDGGIDGQGVLRVNLVSFNVLFQCKRYQGSVGSDAIRDFRGAMQGRADKGLVITTGTFTSSARQEATRDGAPSIDLIDGEDLVILLKDRRLGVTVETVEKVSLDESFFQAI
jgi:restriction system protein